MGSTPRASLLVPCEKNCKIIRLEVEPVFPTNCCKASLLHYCNYRFLPLLSFKIYIQILVSPPLTSARRAGWTNGDWCVVWDAVDRVDWLYGALFGLTSVVNLWTKKLLSKQKKTCGPKFKFQVQTDKFSCEQCWRCPGGHSPRRFSV